MEVLGTGFVELTGEARAVEAECGESAMGVHDVELDGGLLAGRVRSAGEQFGFEERDAAEAPGGIGDFLDELSFGGSGGFVFVEKLLDVEPVSVGIFGSKDGGAGGEAVTEGVERGALFAGFGARARRARYRSTGWVGSVLGRCCHFVLTTVTS